MGAQRVPACLRVWSVDCGNVTLVVVVAALG